MDIMKPTAEMTLEKLRCDEREWLSVTSVCDERVAKCHVCL